MTTPTTQLTSRFEEALTYAFRLHTDQVRKVDGIPYIAHLLSVAVLVLEARGDEDEAIAALLHDAVEDQGGRQTLREIHQRFGERVAEIVDECSDAYTIPKPPWRERKEAYLAHLQKASASTRLVSLADKLHNARSLLRNLERNGDQTWKSFNGGKEGTLWNYRRLAEIFQETGNDPLTADFLEVVRKIEERKDAEGVKEPEEAEEAEEVEEAKEPGKAKGPEVTKEA